MDSQFDSAAAAAPVFARGVDWVISPDGGTIYTSGSDGKVRAYDCATQELLATWAVGIRLGGIDISPDGGYLIVVEQEPLATYGTGDAFRTKIANYQIDVATGKVIVHSLVVEGTGLAMSDVAVLADGRAVFSQDISDAGTTSLWTLDPATGEYSASSPIFAQKSSLWASADGLLVLAEDLGTRTGFSVFDPLAEMRVAVKTNIGGESVQAISARAQMIVAREGSTLQVYGVTSVAVDEQQMLSERYPGRVSSAIAVEFDSSGNYLYVLDQSTSEIVLFRTLDWKLIGSIAVNADLSGLVPGRHSSRFLFVGEDGASFRIVTSSGVIAVDNPFVEEAVLGTDASDTLAGTGADDVLDAQAGDDEVSGLDGTDILRGGDGADVLDGGLGADGMDGGAGADIYYVDHEYDRASETVAGDVDEVRSSVSHHLGVNIENLTFTGSLSIRGYGNQLDNVVVGNGAINYLFGLGGADRLDGRSGNDRLIGAEGDDVLIGGTGADEMSGGKGDDSYFVDNVNDIISELADGGLDQVTSSVSYALLDGIENLILTGTDTISGRGNWSDNRIVGNAAANRLDGSYGRDALVGGAGDDTYILLDRDLVIEEAGGGYDRVETDLTHILADQVEELILTGELSINGLGNGLDNRIVGNDAANRLDGGVGADVLVGGAGGDIYIVDSAADVVQDVGYDHENDRVFSTVSYTLPEGIEQLFLTGAAANGTGNADRNELIGNASANRLDGGLSFDRMQGRDGDDTYVVDSVHDRAIEGVDAGIDKVESSADHEMGSNIETLILTGTAAIGGIGNELANRMVGNNAANRLDGGAGADALIGGLGDDTYVVDEVGDAVKELAGQGSDTVQSTITYRLGNDVEGLILSGTGAIDGTGNALANSITGNSGANILNGGLGRDAMRGGAGNDTFIVDNAGDQASENAGQGIDTVKASISFVLGADIEKLVLGGTGNLNGTGNALNNQITGTSGANRLDGGAGADTLIGGGGSDSYFVDSSEDKVTELAGGGTDQVTSTINYTLGSNVENLTLTGGAWTGTGNDLDNLITGSDGSNNLSGGAGSDALRGGLGNDVLDGGAGIDTMIGDAGDDTFVIDSLSDKMVEAANGGMDTVRTAFDFKLATNFENLVLTGRAALNGTGNAANNRITGNAGANILDGGLGSDTLTGGAGNDYYRVESSQSYFGGAGDAVVEEAGGGIDTVESLLSWSLGEHVENLVLTGTEDIRGEGNSLNNIITGNSGRNSIDGGEGADRMNGGGGDDEYLVDNAGDIISERTDAGYDIVYSSVSHVLSANVEYLSLGYSGFASVNGTGNALANFIGGGDGSNILNGGAGSDTLSGRRGADTLIGGTGVDAFNFTGAFDGTADTITDFDAAQEIIRLYGLVFGAAGPMGVLAENGFHAGKAAHDADDRVIYDAATGKIFYDADGNGEGAAILFAKVTAETELTHVNFVII
jgi:Ca2+-binding RTX toxin-like protein